MIEFRAENFGFSARLQKTTSGRPFFELVVNDSVLNFSKHDCVIPDVIIQL